MAELYATLGVGRDASRHEISRAYRRLVRRHHPDVGGDSARFIRIQEAWEILGDARARTAYDAQLPPPPPPTAPRFRPAPRTTTLPPPSQLVCAAAAVVAVAALAPVAAAAPGALHGRPIPFLEAVALGFVLSRAARTAARKQVGRVQRHRILWSFHVEACDVAVLARADRLARFAYGTTRAWLPLVTCAAAAVAYAATH